MLKISKTIFTLWNSKKIKYCHWKSNEHLEEGLDGITDLDVLVDFKNKLEAEEVLKDCNCIKCTSQYGSRYRLVDEWLGFDEETGKIIHIHLHYRMITGHRGMKEYELQWTKEALQTSISDSKYNLVKIINPDLEIIILYTRIALKLSFIKKIKIFFNKYKLDNASIKEIDFLKKRINKENVQKYVNEFWGNQANDVLGIIFANDLDNSSLRKLIRICNKKYIKFAGNGVIVSIFKRYYYFIVLEVRDFIKKRFKKMLITKKIIRTKGSTIAFLGQDGAGKSTLSNDIEQWLSWKLETQKFYLGSGEYYTSIYRKIRKLFEKRKNRCFKAITGYLTIKDCVFLSRKTYKSFIKINKYISKGGIAIFDRYPQIQFLGINDGPKIRENYLPKVNNFLIKKYLLRKAKLEEKYLKKAIKFNPDLVFKLLLPVEESIKRKPEENIELVRKKSEIVKKLKFNNSIVINIDATQNYEDEIREVKKYIWQQIQ